MVAIQGWYLLSNTLFGMSGYFMALGIAESWNPVSVFPVAASLLFADAIGLVAVISHPGVGQGAGGHCNTAALPAALRSPRTLPEGPNDTYRSPNAVKAGVIWGMSDKAHRHLP
jgi:hypothetical protein